ncbi:hypothetical protein K1719_020852 [Acacia pycnantha]|nr:hypothetical protein K1719_020852 [Acacia pycnantha]
MDKVSGSGFGSKMNYGSGFFHLRIKVPDRDSSGVVTAYYLTSQGERHDEVDFEFLGNKEGKPYTLQTNVFADGKGNKEQRIRLWFDPSADFHDYRILWNPHQLVFYVDNIPIRVYKNKSDVGVAYPSKAMQIKQRYGMEIVGPLMEAKPRLIGSLLLSKLTFKVLILMVVIFNLQLLTIIILLVLRTSSGGTRNSFGS